jgi:hypothetical protein
MSFNSSNPAFTEWLIRTYVEPHTVHAFMRGTVFLYGGFPPTSPYLTNKSWEAGLYRSSKDHLDMDMRCSSFYLRLHPENADLMKEERFNPPFKFRNDWPLAIREITGEQVCEYVIKACIENHSDVLTIFAEPIHAPLIMAEVVALLKREALFDPAAKKLSLRVYIKTVNACNWSSHDGFQSSGCSDWLSFVSGESNRLSGKIASPKEVVEYYNMRDVANEEHNRFVQACTD